MTCSKWELLLRLLDSGCPMQPFVEKHYVQLRAGATVGGVYLHHDGPWTQLALPFDVTLRNSIRFTNCYLKVAGGGEFSLLTDFTVNPGSTAAWIQCISSVFKDTIRNETLFRQLLPAQRLTGYLVFESSSSRYLHPQLGEKITGSLWLEDDQENIYGIPLELLDASSPDDLEDWHAQVRSCYGIESCISRKEYT